MPGVLRILIGLSTIVTFGTTYAQGNDSLARKCKDLPALVLGTDEAGFAVGQKTCELETGKCYKLAIESTGKQEYAIRGPDFFRNLWSRKIETGDMEIKAKHIYPLEFEVEAKAELYFVQIVTGTFTLFANRPAKRAPLSQSPSNDA